MRLIFAVALIALVQLLPSFAQTPRQLEQPASDVQKRIALVIGNGNYQKASKLANPANDARDTAAALQELGFEVIGGGRDGIDLTQSAMEALIARFGQRLAETKGVGLFFYAGHGVTSAGQNYLIPVDADIPDEDLVKYKAVSVGYVLDKMAAAKNDFNLIILDACRNNPFARQWRSLRDIGDSKGLVNSNPPRGTLVLYATQPGGVAIDGAAGSRNGVFTEALLKNIRQPDVELDRLVKLVARDVETASKDKQSPWKEGLYSGDFYFKQSNGNVKPNPRPETPVRKEPVVGEVRKSSAWIDLVWIPPGEFMMGSPESEKGRNNDEGPQQKVKIGYGFWMGKFEVTQKQWEVVMGGNPSTNKRGPDYPVNFVRMSDIQEFIKRLNTLDPVFEYRLPSEAEWEYACRAGTTTAYAFGESLDSTQANLQEFATVPVGSYKPNAWGLYDMHDNVMEWVQDSYSPNHRNQPADGSAVKNSNWGHVLKGGRSAQRAGLEAVAPGIGFRIAAQLK